MKLVTLSVFTHLLELITIGYLCASVSGAHTVERAKSAVTLQTSVSDHGTNPALFPPLISSADHQMYLDNELAVTARGSYTVFGWNENFLPLELIVALDLSHTQVESIKAAVLRFIASVQNHEKSIGRFLSSRIFFIPKYPEFQLAALNSLREEISSTTSDEIATRILPCLLLDPAMSAGNFDTELVASRSSTSIFAEAKYRADRPEQTHRLSGNSNVNFFFERYGLVLDLKKFLESEGMSED